MWIRKNFLISFFKAIFPLIFCAGLITAPCPDALAAKKKGPYVVTAKSAILYDVTRSKLLYGRHIHQRVWPASTTKVMTALLVMERLSTNKVVTVSERATRPQPTKLYLQPGEKYTVEALLYAILMKSANDATVVLAEAVAGSEKEFVKLMNQRARQLGAKNTKFLNSHGLPTEESQYTTASDMRLILKQALRYPLFRKILAHRQKTIVSQTGKRIHLKSYNKLLWKDWKKVVRGKTGYTRKAKHCFVGFLTEGNNIYVINVFGCRQRWSDIRYILTQYGKFKL